MTGPLELIRELTGPGGENELVTEDVLGTPMQVFRHRQHRLADLVRDSVAHGDRDYLVTTERRISFAEHARGVASLARTLADDYGITRGDRVGIAAANCPEWITMFWAVASLGAITVAYNAWWSARELAYAVGHTSPRVVLADSARASLLADTDSTVVTIEQDFPRMVRKNLAAELPEVDVAEDDPAVIVYTSGTSGRPKGAVHSHRNLLAIVDYHRLTSALVDPRAAQDRRYLLATPLFHIAGLHNLAVPRLATGNTIVLYQGAFDVDRVLRLVERERVTSWAMVPTMARRLVRHGDLAPYDLSALSSLTLASAPSSPELQDKLRSAVPGIGETLVDTYGQTESTTAISIASSADLAASPGTVGRPIPTVDLEIRDRQGKAVPDGEEGEVCVRSPFVMLGYWQDPEATARAIRPGRWLHTGDVGVVEQGLLRLTGRRTDLILRGGENVYPAEVENALAEHPAVEECAVLGVPDDDLGQRVAAVVVVADPAAVTTDELTDFATDRLARFKVPSAWRLTTEPLPRNATGKVIRAEILGAWS